jgi:hypothetical protein
MEDASDLPWVAERFSGGLNATVQTTPAMTFEDVEKGLGKAFGQTSIAGHTSSDAGPPGESR